MLHLYAVTEQPAKLPDSSGIDGRSVDRVAGGSVDAVVSDVGPSAATPNEAAVLAHARVVEELMAENDAVLPARFGHGFADEDEVARVVAARESQLREALVHVRGCVELGLRVVAGTDEATEEGRSGAEYMRQRLKQVQTAERTADEVHAVLASSARAETRQVLPTPRLLLTAAYLVPRDEVDSFRLRVEALEHEHRGLSFLCTGPWPPYSFATVDAERAHD